MIIGIGTDILHLPRLRSLIARRGVDALAKRILSADEAKSREWRLKQRDEKASTAYLGIRWAAKEAAYKAVYPSFCPTWKDFSILKPEGKDGKLGYKPFLSLSSSRLLDVPTFHLSVSHDADQIVAFVLAEAAETSK